MTTERDTSNVPVLAGGLVASSGTPSPLVHHIGRARTRYELMAPNDAREALARLPVVLVAAVCRDEVGCGDEMALLPLLAPQTAVDVMFTDMTLFAMADGLHLFHRMVRDGASVEEYDGEMRERTISVTTTSGTVVDVPLVVDPERAKLYCATVMRMSEEDRDAFFGAMDLVTTQSNPRFGVDEFCGVLAFVLACMRDDELEEDEDFVELVESFGDLFGYHLKDLLELDRLVLEQEMLEPHLVAMARNFTVAANLFEEHADKGVDELLGDLEF